MKKNMSNADRLVRLAIALVIAICWFQHMLTGTLGIIALIVGAVFALTSVAGTCPLYSMFGINTCGRKKVV